MAVGIITESFNQILDVASNIIPNLQPTALKICVSLIIIDLTMSALASVEEDVFSMLWKKIIKYGFYLYMIKNWASLTGYVRSGFIWIGNKATGTASTELIVNPESIISKGLSNLTMFLAGDALVALATFISNPALAITAVVLALTIIVGLMFMGIEIMLVLVEFYLVTGFGIMLIPFGVHKSTSFIAQRAFNGIISSGIKLSVISLVYNVCFKVLDERTIDMGDVTSLVTYATTLLLCIFIARQASTIATAVMSGGGGMTGEQASNMAKQAMGTVSASNVAGGDAVKAIKSATSTSTNGSTNSSNGSGGTDAISATKKASGG